MREPRSSCDLAGAFISHRTVIAARDRQLSGAQERISNTGVTFSMTVIAQERRIAKDTVEGPLHFCCITRQHQASKSRFYVLFTIALTRELKWSIEVVLSKFRKDLKPLVKLKELDRRRIISA